MYPDSVEYKFNPRYLSAFEMEVFNDTEGISRINLTSSLKTTFERVLIFVQSKKKNQMNDKHYDKELYKATINICEASKGLFGMFFFKNIMAEAEKYTNFTFVCPIKPNKYHAANIPYGGEFFNSSFFLDFKVVFIEICLIQLDRRHFKPSESTLFEFLSLEKT
jgi:Protein of unknown function (DUF1091)